MLVKGTLSSTCLPVNHVLEGIIDTHKTVFPYTNGSRLDYAQRKQLCRKLSVLGCVAQT